MWTCPVCKNQGEHTFCPHCGFDRSRSYKHFPTLAPLQEQHKAVSAIRFARVEPPENTLRCSACGGAQFFLSAGDLTGICVQCGREFTAAHLNMQTEATQQPANPVNWHTDPERASRRLLSVSGNTILFLSPDSLVYAPFQYTGDEKNWSHIISIVSSQTHSAGLTAWGNVLITCDDRSRSRKIEGWINTIAVAVGNHFTVGLSKNGNVSAIGSNGFGQCNVQNWSKIRAIAAGTHHTVGIQADGTAVATGNNSSGQCDVHTWTNIAAAAAGTMHTVGLRPDGTVIAVGNNNYGQCNVDAWRDIVEIAAGSMHTVGLRADGTVLATGWNKCGQCYTDNWKNVIAIAAGADHTAGIRNDGTIICAGIGLRYEIQSHWDKTMSRQDFLDKTDARNALISNRSTPPVGVGKS